jgi:hypothetical protein
MKKYQLPPFLSHAVDQTKYERWLSRASRTHVRRDRNRGNRTATNQEYKTAIHKAVCESGGRDFYTNEELEWSKLSEYRNEQSKKEGRRYKKTFALLPSVDHVGDGSGPASFRICAWRTNDAKNDLSYEDFIDLCAKVLKAAGQL